MLCVDVEDNVLGVVFCVADNILGGLCGVVEDSCYK